MSVQKSIRFILNIIFLLFLSNVSFSQQIEKDSTLTDTEKTGLFKRIFSGKKLKHATNHTSGSISTDGTKTDSQVNTNLKDPGSVIHEKKSLVIDSLTENLSKLDSLKPKVSTDDVYGLQDSLLTNPLSEEKKTFVENNKTLKNLRKHRATINNSEAEARRIQSSLEDKQIEELAGKYLNIPSSELLKDRYENSVLKKFRDQSDSVRQKLDSIQQIDLKVPDLHQNYDLESITKEHLQLLDSLKPDNPFKEKVSKISDSLNVLEYKKKRLIPLKNYKELVIGARESLEDGFTLSPALGFELSENFSVGFGSTIDFNFKREYMNVGYRTFVRYNLFSFMYTQAEAIHYFRNFSNPTEAPADKTVDEYQYNLTAGFGGTYPLSKKININVQLLYQIKTTEYHPNGSPLIFRAGINF